MYCLFCCFRCVCLLPCHHVLVAWKKPSEEEFWAGGRLRVKYEWGVKTFSYWAPLKTHSRSKSNHSMSHVPFTQWRYKGCQTCGLSHAQVSLPFIRRGMEGVCGIVKSSIILDAIFGNCVKFIKKSCFWRSEDLPYLSIICGLEGVQITKNSISPPPFFMPPVQKSRFFGKVQ